LSIPADLTVGDWLLIAAFAIGLYSIILLPLRNSERWRKRGVTTWGPIPVAIFIRTKRGLGLLDRLARPKTLWRIVASAGVPLVVLSMVYFLVLVLLMAYLMIRSPPEPSSYNAPRNILLIPGVNQYIPFVWGWIALFVTMVVHEFSHGILSRVEGVRVKSMGLVMLLIAPIAAFAEPDDEDLFGTKDKPPKVGKGARIRIISAGVISNFIVAAIAIAIFFGPVIGSIAPVDRLIVSDVQNGSIAAQAGFENKMMVLSVNSGNVSDLTDLYNALKLGPSSIGVLSDSKKEDLALQGTPVQGIMVASVLDGSPAADAGLPANTVITSINGTDIGNLDGFRSYMNTTHPGQNITITATSGKYNISLATKYDGTGQIGIGISGNAVYVSGAIFQEFPARAFLDILRRLPAAGVSSFFAIFLTLPFTGVSGLISGGFQGFSGWTTNFFVPTGWAAPLGGYFFWIANLLLWIGWINLYAGLFNCLPAVPLDGGYVFRDLVQACFERVVNVKEAERLTRTVVAILAWLVLTSLLISVFAPFTHGLSI
jgi:membrane-associated protease RseP (regulator of RpoE activity)